MVINNDGTNGQIGPQALKAVYDVSAKIVEVGGHYTVLVDD